MEEYGRAVGNILVERPFLDYPLSLMPRLREKIMDGIYLMTAFELKSEGESIGYMVAFDMDIDSRDMEEREIEQRSLDLYDELEGFMENEMEFFDSPEEMLS